MQPNLGTYIRAAIRSQKASEWTLFKVRLFGKRCVGTCNVTNQVVTCRRWHGDLYMFKAEDEQDIVEGQYRKKERQAQLLWWSLVIALIGCSAIIMHALSNSVAYAEEPAPMVYEDWRPPIHKCPEDVELWECMRHAMWRTDL